MMFFFIILALQLAFYVLLIFGSSEFFPKYGYSEEENFFTPIPPSTLLQHPPEYFSEYVAFNSFLSTPTSTNTSRSGIASTSSSSQASPDNQIYTGDKEDEDDEDDAVDSLHHRLYFTPKSQNLLYYKATLIWEYQIQHQLKNNIIDKEETLPIGTELYVTDLCPVLYDMYKPSIYCRSTDLLKDNSLIVAHCIRKKDFERHAVGNCSLLAIPISLLHFHNYGALEKLVIKLKQKKRSISGQKQTLKKKSLTTTKRGLTYSLEDYEEEKESYHQACNCQTLFKCLNDYRPVLCVSLNYPVVFKPTPCMIQEYGCIQLIKDPEQTGEGEAEEDHVKEENMVYVIEMEAHAPTGWSFIIQISWSDRDGAGGKTWAHGWIPTKLIHFDHQRNLLAEHFIQNDNSKMAREMADCMVINEEEYMEIPKGRTTGKPFSKISLMRPLTMHGGAMGVDKLLMPLGSSSNYWVLIEPQERQKICNHEGTAKDAEIRYSVSYEMNRLCWVQCSLASPHLDSDLTHYWKSLEAPKSGSWGYAPSTFFFSKLYMDRVIELPIAMSETLQASNDDHGGTGLDMTGLRYILTINPDSPLCTKLLHQSPILYDSKNYNTLAEDQEKRSGTRWKLMYSYDPFVTAQHCVELESNPTPFVPKNFKLPSKQAEEILRLVNCQGDKKHYRDTTGNPTGTNKKTVIKGTANPITKIPQIKTPAPSIKYQRMKQALLKLAASTSHYQLSTITDLSVERFDKGGNGFICIANAHFGAHTQPKMHNRQIAVKFIPLRKFDSIESEAVGLNTIAVYNKKRWFKRNQEREKRNYHQRPSLEQMLDTSCAPFPSVYGYFLVRIKKMSSSLKKKNKAKNAKESANARKGTRKPSLEKDLLNFQIVDSELPDDKWFKRDTGSNQISDERGDSVELDMEVYVGLCMEYIHGLPLSAFLSTSDVYQGNFPISHMGTVVKQLLKALYVMSKLGLCHRDIKPRNILIRRKNSKQPIYLQELVIIDYGNCCHKKKCLRKCSLGTTTLYAHPVALNPTATWEKCDLRNDLRSAAMVIFELVLTRHVYPYNSSMTEQMCIELVRKYPKTPYNYQFPLCLDQSMKYLLPFNQSISYSSKKGRGGGFSTLTMGHRQLEKESKPKSMTRGTLLTARRSSMSTIAEGTKDSCHRPLPSTMPQLLADLLGRIFVGKYEEMPDLKDLLQNHPYITGKPVFEQDKREALKKHEPRHVPDLRTNEFDLKRAQSS